MLCEQRTRLIHSVYVAYYFYVHVTASSIDDLSLIDGDFETAVGPRHTYYCATLWI